MKNDIILAGVGGQGILSIAATIGMSAVDAGLNLKQAEVHGMSQRGGDVQSHLRISDKQIYSDLIPKGFADLIISVEPMEALRYLPWIGKDSWIITNSNPFVNIPNYPETEEVLKKLKTYTNVVVLDADALAKDAGSAKSANMVILGAASPFLCLSLEQLQNGIRSLWGRKGEEIVNMNLNAFQKGRDIALEIANV